MKAATTVLLALFFNITSVFADSKAPTPVDPARYLGKTFDDCEKTLGKPVDVRTLTKGGLIVRSYAPNSEFFDYIELASDAGRYPTLFPNSVTSISYGLKKEPDCSYLGCMGAKSPKHKLVSFKDLYTVFGFEDLENSARSLPQGVETTLHPYFGYFTEGGGSLAGFRMMIPSKTGNVQSEFWSIQWLESEDKTRLSQAEKLRTTAEKADDAEAITTYVKAHSPRDRAEVRLYFTSSQLSWTSHDGKTIKADFVKLDGEAVVVRMENGKEHKIPFTRLSSESAAQARKLSGTK